MAFTTGTNFSVSAGYTTGNNFNIQDATTPLQGEIVITGQTPSAIFGAVVAAVQGEIVITGQTPAAIFGVNSQPVQGEIVITGGHPKFAAYTVIVEPSQGAIIITGQNPSEIHGFVIAPSQGSIAITGQTPTFLSRRYRAIAINWLATRYRCELTGSPDIEIPIKSFQVRYNASRIYLSAVVAAGAEWLTAINARANGILKLFRIYQYTDGSEEIYPIAQASLSTIRIDEGGSSGQTLSLSAYAAAPAAVPLTIDLYDPTYYSSTNGVERRYRCRLDPRLRPGDTATIAGDSFTVGEIIQYVDTATTIMEVAEA